MHIFTCQAITFLCDLDHFSCIFNIKSHYLKQIRYHFLHLLDLRPKTKIECWLQNFQKGLDIDQPTSVINVEVDCLRLCLGVWVRFRWFCFCIFFRFFPLKRKLIYSFDIIKDQLHCLLDLWRNVTFGVGNIEISKLIPLLHLCNTIYFLVIGVFNKGMMDKSNERLEQKILLYCTLM